jgi:hypothetical protein
MRLLHSRTTAVLLAAGLLVGGANLAAYAANGKPLLLGKANKETKSAVLQNTGAGPALKIKTKASAPPLAVSSSKKVANLNADKLDGLDSQALQTYTTMYTLPPESALSNFAVALPGLAPGLYHATFSITAIMSAPGAKLDCYISNGATAVMLAYGSTYGSASSSNASGIVDTRTSAAKLVCFTEGGSATVTTSSPTPQLTFTRIDGITAGIGTVGRHTARLTPTTH